LRLSGRGSSSLAGIRPLRRSAGQKVHWTFCSSGLTQLKGGMLNPIAALLIETLEIYKWIVIAAVIVSWLTAFNVINVHNNIVRTLLRILLALTEPVFRQIRRVVPPIAGLDLSPIIVFVIIWFLQYSITWASFRYGL
jgi:YggT family protein